MGTHTCTECHAEVRNSNHLAHRNWHQEVRNAFAQLHQEVFVKQGL